MKKILISIRPEWVAKILNGEKTIEVRKTTPKCELPCEVYIYCTKEKNKFDTLIPDGDKYLYGCPYENFHYLKVNGKVVARFTLNKVETICCEGLENGCGGHNYFYSLEDGEDIRKKACLDEFDLRNYLGTKLDGDEVGYAWHIDNLVIFDKPKELWEFDSPNRFIPCEKCLLYKSFLEGKCKGQHCNSLYKAPQSYCFCEVNE